VEKLNKQEKPTLYILTLTFPFSGAAEDNFLRPELAVLSKSFQVVVVPRSQEGAQTELPEGCTLDLGLSKGINSEPARGWHKLKRLLTKEVFRELLESFPRSLHAAYLSRIATDYLLGEYAVEWIRSKKLNYYPESLIVCGWWLTPEITAIAREGSKDGILVVSRAHGGDLYEFRDHPPGKPFRERSIAFLSGVYPDSTRGYHYICKRWPAVSGVTSVAHLGTHNFGLSLTPRYPKEKLRVMSCSFVHPVKQLDLALRGLMLFALANRSTQVEWTHVGDGDLSEILEVEYPLPNNLEVIQIPYPGLENLRKMYLTQEIDVFINTSASEGVPVALMEAASCGVSLIGPDIGGVSEIIRDEVNGFLMKPEASAVALAKSLTKFMELSPEAKSELRENSRATWAAYFDASATYQEFADRLLTLLNEKERM
jgi:glycosyltransferase involved in cell wall biosynthesis